jgi:hypothetical protein
VLSVLVPYTLARYPDAIETEFLEFDYPETSEPEVFKPTYQRVVNFPCVHLEMMVVHRYLAYTRLLWAIASHPLYVRNLAREWFHNTADDSDPTPPPAIRTAAKITDLIAKKMKMDF